MQTISKDLVALLSILVSIEDSILQVSNLRLNGVFEELVFCTNLIRPITPIIGTFADLGIELFDRLMDFRELLRLHVLVVDSPLTVLHPKVLAIFLQVLDAADKVLLNRGDHFLKAGHLRLDDSIHIVDVLHGRLLEIYQPLLRVTNLLLYHTLTAENVSFDFF